MNQRDNAALQRLAGELLETLQPARLALEGQSGEPPSLAGCVRPLDQASRALRSGDLHALALLAEESGALVRALLDERIGNPGDALVVLTRAVRELPLCLDALARAEAACPPALLQVLDDLRVLRGEALLAQGSLFTPALPAPSPSLPEEAIAARTTAELPTLLRKLRQALQMALLAMLREPSQVASRITLGRVFARLERLARQAPQDALWSAAAALADGLENDTLSDGPAIRLLLRQLDRQLRQLVEEGASGLNRTAPDALLRGLLFYVAQLPAGSPRTEELQSRYRLSEALPDAERLDGFAARTPPPRISADAMTLDRQLLAIFADEAQTHLSALGAFLDACAEGPPRLPSDELERALHTLRGSALLAGVRPVAELATPLDAMIRDFQARQLPLVQAEVALLQTGETLLRRAVQNLAGDPLAAPEGATAFILDVQVAHRLRLEQAQRGDLPASAAAAEQSLCSATPAGIINSLGLIDDAWLVDGGVWAGSPDQPASEACDGDILQVFADEASDLLDDLQAVLAPWSAQPESAAPSLDLLRILHTLKGAARLAGQARLADLAHALEQPLTAAGQASYAQMHNGYRDLRDELDAISERLEQQLRREPQVDVASLRVPQRLLRVPDESLQRLSRLAARASSVRERIARLSTHNAPLETLLAEQAQLDEEIEQALLHARQVPFEQLLPRLRRLVRQLAGQLNKQIELRCEDALGAIDRGVLERLVAPLEHLLRNAVDHGIESAEQRRAAGKPESGTLTLQLSRDGADLLLVLADDGAGIDYAAVRREAVARGLIEGDAELAEPAALQLIFTPGFSTAAQLTQVSGRGIGLDTIDAAIRQLGGTLQVESTAGQGSRWLIRLPEVQGEVTGAPLPRVVVVDDSPTARQVLGRLLERNGLGVEVFADGTQALGHLRGARPDLLILDRNLPQPDGLEIARQVRGEVGLEDLPILMLSADEAPLDAAQAERVNACLAKPFQDAQLLASIRQLLSTA